MRSRLSIFILVVLAFVVGAIAQWTGIIYDLFVTYRPDIVFLTRQHMFLVLVSGSLAIVVGIPLGILLSRPFMRRVSESIMQGLNVGTTIPTLALLALSMSLLGIGTVPSIFGLFVASLLPIVRNAYAGLLGVPAHLKEAATGMGMTGQQMLWRVEVPNALFVMFAGIRTALAINVGTAPLAFLIGGGGLGELIFTGIDLMETSMMLSGAIPTALLAVLVDFIIGQAQFWLIPRGVNPLR